MKSTLREDHINFHKNIDERAINSVYGEGYTHISRKINQNARRQRRENAECLRR